MRAILAGGGTGGHVIPALAIAQELQKLHGAEVLFIGTARGLELGRHADLRISLYRRQDFRFAWLKLEL